ncbi:hypothetical protein Leryth_006642 [Lithospermum erythrorhizon]|nr:hypothetical protein Leryth_006642 [Lithospermum erythrorhizon]
MREGLRSRTSNKDCVEGEGKKDDEVVGTNVTESKCNRGKELGSNGRLDAIFVPEVRVEEEIVACEIDRVGKSDAFSVPVGDVSANGEHVDGVDAKNCNGEHVNGVDAENFNGEQVDGVVADSCNVGQVDGVGHDNGNGDQADNVQSKGRRGRKRKNPQVSSNARRVEMIDLNEPPVVHLSMRVLRSRTVADGLVKEDVKDVDEKTYDEVKKKLKLEKNVEHKSAKPSTGRVLRSRTVADDLVKGDLNDVDEETYDEVNKKKLKLEKTAENKSAEPSIGRVLRSRTVADDLVKGDLNDVVEETDEEVDEVGKKKSKLKHSKDKSAEPSNRRVLRPRTVADDLVKGDLNDVDEETDGGVVEVDKNELKQENVADKSAEHSMGRVLRSRTVAVHANNLVKGDLNDMDEETGEVVDEKKSKLENAEDESAEPSRRGKKKKIKGRRGRPSKGNVENGYAVVIVGNKDKVLGSKVNLKSGTSISKLKGESGVSEKKDIRNQIIDVIVRCGWKIQLVPRASKDYNDPVYVNPEGKTHWSITKAYKDLKERIDNGKANDVERAGFTVIPDETLSKLFRVITKKRSDCGIKRSEVVQEKGLVKNRASSKKTDESQSCGRKRKLVPLGGRKRRFALLARGSGNRSDRDDDERELYNKKRSLLSWMIDLGTVPEGADVQYRDPIEGAALLDGKVTHDGLACNCCNEVHTIIGFQLHAGSKSGEPLKNLYLVSGLSLFQCMVNAWSQQVELSKIGFCSVDVAVGDCNDDTCNMCGDGGDLMCCDFCPSTFHLSCLDIEDVPVGDWHCMYCSCKFCGSVGDEALSQEDGHHLMTCQLCEAKFHSTCTDQTDAKSMNSATALFCVGLKHEMEGGLSWTILCRNDVGNDASLHDYPLKIECNAKLAVAYSVMDECFLPVVDPRSQSDMIVNVIYNCGSNFRRLNYSGFYTFILEKGDEVVSVASIRFHGTQLAEMPFVATRNIYRRQGLSRQLLTVIEKALSSMDIQKLVIPAVSDVMAMWTGSFDFIPLKEATWQEMKTMGIIAFPGTDMLQKSLLETTGADPGDEILNAIVDLQAVHDSEQKDDSGQKGDGRGTVVDCAVSHSSFC